MFRLDSDKVERLFVEGVRPKFNLERSVTHQTRQNNTAKQIKTRADFKVRWEMGGLVSGRVGGCVGGKGKGGFCRGW